ncbi:hypothetical protein SAMN05443633_101394 [Chryseobacterium arachidis]|uniref:Uncharacterized protein n=1 Tax=Chryseobacterium arachidis TaxID=1416778 RepID=A0A1M4U350_9FLAO|nr:hypothetical protein SAMN05443633_101394 [Chryseobacterium arachidis]
MSIMNSFSLKIKINKIYRFIIFGSVILFTSCEKRIDKIDKVEEIHKRDSIQLISDIPIIKGLKENELINYVKYAPTIKPNKNNGIPFNNLNYDKIIAYDFNCDEKMYDNVIDKNGKFIPIIEKQQFLTQKQADKILSALTKKSSYGEASAACFNPHLGLVFFKNNKKVNQISICLDCNDSTSEIDIPARRHKVFNKGTDSEYSFTGYTSKGKTAVIDLCKELQFYYKSAIPIDTKK